MALWLGWLLDVRLHLTLLALLLFATIVSDRTTPALDRFSENDALAGRQESFLQSLALMVYDEP
jgi:hypothetical protein